MPDWLDLKNNNRLYNIYKTRAKITKIIREFFWEQHFIEVETPIALYYPDQEPHINSIPLKIHNQYRKSEQFYLQTSPEFSMKKLLSAGYNKIFQICKCFRDIEQFGGIHNPEFTMIEWYQTGNYFNIMDDTEALFKYIGKHTNISFLEYKDIRIKIDQVWDRISMKQLWQNHLNINLDKYLTRESIKELVHSKGYPVEKEEPYEDLFYKIFLNEIEPYLGKNRPIFIYNYPASMASLAQLSPNADYAERFELYICGLEISNAFTELIDPVEQENRFIKNQSCRKKMNKNAFAIDNDFIDALKSGITPSAGIALGVDRLVMLFTNALDLNEVIFINKKN